eukprot:UN23571
MSTQNLKQSPEFWTILTLLQAFQSVKIPYESVIELSPKMQYRLFTISSSSITQPTKVAVTAKLEFHKRKDR